MKGISQRDATKCRTPRLIFAQPLEIRGFKTILGEANENKLLTQIKVCHASSLSGLLSRKPSTYRTLG